VLASLPVIVAQTHFQLIVQADYGFATTNLAWLLGPVTNLTVNGVLAAVGHLSVGSAVLTWVAGQTLGTIVLAGHIVLRGAGFGRPDSVLARRTLGFGLKSHVGRVMMLGNYRLDQWILGAIAGSRELGLYSVAVAWAESLFYLPTTLTMVQRPDLVRAARADAGTRAAVLLRAAFLLSIPVALVLFIFAPVLCAGVFGSSFRGSIVDLRVLVLGGLGVIAMKQLSGALTAQNMPLSASAGIGVALVATVGLDLALIPSHGALGAAIASTLAYSIGGIAIGLIFARKLHTSPREFLPRRGDAASLWHASRRLLARALRQEPTPV
jgi:O-antigen/teichoic acid export membrane protein